MEKFRALIDKLPTWFLPAVAIAAILWLTLAPHPAGKLDIPLFPGADKIVHVALFGFLAFVVLLEAMKEKRWTTLSLFTIGVISFLCTGFGVGIEFIQKAMGLGRSLELLDMAADGAGAFGIGGVWAAMQGVFAKPE